MICKLYFNKNKTLSKLSPLNISNIGGSLKWSRQWSPRFYSNALVAYSEYFSDYYRFTDQEIRNPEADTLIRAIRRGSLEDNNITDLTVGLDNEWQASKNRPRKLLSSLELHLPSWTTHCCSESRCTREVGFGWQ